jgi:hypothetical protein
MGEKMCPSTTSTIKDISHAGSSHGLRSRSLHNVQHETAQRERRGYGYSMSDPSITVAEAFKQFSQVTVSAVGPSGVPFLPSILPPPPLPRCVCVCVCSSVSLNDDPVPISSFALTNMGLVQDSLKPRTISASCDTNATIRSEILTLAKNNLGLGSQK